MLKQLKSDLSAKYINPSEKKEQRVSMYRLKRVYDLIIDSTESNEIYVDKKIIESVNNNEENSFIENISEKGIVIPVEKPKPIPVNIKINLSKSLTNEYLANTELFDLNLSFPVRKLKDKNSLLNKVNPSILLNNRNLSSSTILNIESKTSVKQNKNLENNFIEDPLKNRQNSNIIMPLKHLEDFVRIDDIAEDLIKRTSSDIILNNNNSKSSNNNSFEIGEMFWTKLGKSPNWPSIVVNPDVNVTTNTKSKTSVIHVKFFNDSGRRAMVLERQIKPYNGSEEFLKTVSLFFLIFIIPLLLYF